MLNNYTILVGFVEKEPTLEKDANTKEEVCSFNIVVKDNKKVRSVMCLATGRLCDQVMIHAIKGSFWAVGGILYNHQSDKMKKSKLTLKCLELELLNAPRIPGIGVEEFVGKYSPESIIKRAMERKKHERQRT